MKLLRRRSECGDDYGSEDTWAYCTRRKGHRGKHRCTLTWPQRVPQPRDPNREPSAMELAMQRAWAPTLERALTTQILRAPATTGTVPIVTGTVRGHLVNRDTLEDQA